MNTTQDDYVREKTRRIVGHAALRRASRIIQTWQAEEQEKTRIAKHILLITLLLAASGGICFYLFR